MVLLVLGCHDVVITFDDQSATPVECDRVAGQHDRGAPLRVDRNRIASFSASGHKMTSSQPGDGIEDEARGERKSGGEWRSEWSSRRPCHPAVSPRSDASSRSIATAQVSTAVTGMTFQFRGRWAETDISVMSLTAQGSKGPDHGDELQETSRRYSRLPRDKARISRLRRRNEMGPCGHRGHCGCGPTTKKIRGRPLPILRAPAAPLPPWSRSFPGQWRLLP